MENSKIPNTTKSYNFNLILHSKGNNISRHLLDVLLLGYIKFLIRLKKGVRKGFYLFPKNSDFEILLFFPSPNQLQNFMFIKMQKHDSKFVF